MKGNGTKSECKVWFQVNRANVSFKCNWPFYSNKCFPGEIEEIDRTFPHFRYSTSSCIFVHPKRTSSISKSFKLSLSFGRFIYEYILLRYYFFRCKQEKTPHLWQRNLKNYALWKKFNVRWIWDQVNALWIFFQSSLWRYSNIFLIIKTLKALLKNMY